ncbi:unnamed protein product [Bubo scandiacus]
MAVLVLGQSTAPAAPHTKGRGPMGSPLGGMLRGGRQAPEWGRPQMGLGRQLKAAMRHGRENGCEIWLLKSNGGPPASRTGGLLAQEGRYDGEKSQCQKRGGRFLHLIEAPHFPSAPSCLPAPCSTTCGPGPPGHGCLLP